MKKAVFLDRDGVLTQEPPYYAHKVDELEFIPRSPDAIRILNKNNYAVIIVSNQSGIARGYYPEEDTAIFNKAMEKKLAETGSHIDTIYYCPHHPEAKIERYRVNCDCRKPRPGMLKRAEKELNIDLKQSFMVGDRMSDIEAGKRAECKTILVRTGYNSGQSKENEIICDYVANDLYNAVEYILSLP
ncbi:MAG: putative HAD-hydrolase [Candidatus Methanoperedens nitroreducens]|uniref:D,D-heptose 1,7-bisphosphate phosphatase n=1 Tax=Candidatus Methanoperedens nitratireducens TaxID=1392998 RepID=A0A0P8DWH5_9EURY|nr:D-glycero-beta-D-manno-heptose 1,7-bisphosphate 7-phosphatase [Candidatus Methanoperedens sp. BLZ2]KAB2946554.1 MAG: D-glycero-beta-D-manno-heptose 1,7-bisphosphate 7-phosphatase [Candidatus Methanoperedens sp.]KPQ41974.1 MAG: putative HAD-hydrolase [Candidatus Methanoperedens sp. BLZ1]MBZ0175056.1 D-glycero-beta-D-manno-heptose 1,7-bisphosphate 7-phosphatase [Candidatus Methanoperedens nitroreducens]